MNKAIIISIVSLLITIAVLYFLSPMAIDKIKLKQVKGLSTESITDLKPARLPSKSASYTNPIVNAKANLLMDLDSAYILHEDKASEQVPIASTTKIATALVVLENYPDRLNDKVLITAKMINVDGSDIQLRPGEEITVENLLKGLLIMSGNDTAYSLATYFGGKESFVNEMNEKVKQIGANNTRYKDPAGLDDEGYSTAHDLAIIAGYALRNPKFREIVKTPSEDVYSINGLVKHELKNSNRMLRDDEAYFYPYAIGIKTGFTYAAGHVLVSAAQKDGHTLLSVILNTYENTNVASAKESKRYLEWGFNNWVWS